MAAEFDEARLRQLQEQQVMLGQVVHVLWRMLNVMRERVSELEAGRTVDPAVAADHDEAIDLIGGMFEQGGRVVRFPGGEASRDP